MFRITILAAIVALSLAARRNKLDALNRLSEGLPVEDPISMRRGNAQKPLTWTQGNNFPNTDARDLYHLLGVRGNYKFLPERETKDFSQFQLPHTFDARTQWSNCPSISKIRDQGCCGDCWAVAAVESMSDRLCIHSNGQIKKTISAEDLMSCCTYCGDNPNNQTAGGCQGAFSLDYAWEWWITNGLVTGGGYDSEFGCLPYEIPTTPKNGCLADAPTPACVQQCQPGYQKTWQQDLTWGLTAYSVAQETYSIQGEVLLNGPVEAAFLVYEDFFNYTSGVYQHTSGQLAGGHAIRILGWGTENGLPYWLCANSWGTSWGDLGGYFKILRGVNECGIEENVTTGLPALSNTRGSRHQ